MLQMKLLEKVIDFGVIELVKQIRCLAIEIYDAGSVNTAVNSKICVQQFLFSSFNMIKKHWATGSYYEGACNREYIHLWKFHSGFGVFEPPAINK